jgi:hypothetical protein
LFSPDSLAKSLARCRHTVALLGRHTLGRAISKAAVDVMHGVIAMVVAVALAAAPVVVHDPADGGSFCATQPRRQ